MRMILIFIISSLILGCGSGKQTPVVSRLSSVEMASLGAEHSRFERSEDPAFSVETHFAAGQLAESQGAYPRAAQQYRAALKLEPKHRPSLYRLALVCTQMKDFPTAIELWRQYVEITGREASAYGNLGFCYELAGQLAEAEAAYKLGIERDGKNGACRVNYGLLLARQNRPTEALEQLRAVLTEAQAHYNLGSLYEQMGRREQAKAEYRRAVEVEPGLVDAHARLATLEQ